MRGWCAGSPSATAGAIARPLRGSRSGVVVSTGAIALEALEIVRIEEFGVVRVRERLQPLMEARLAVGFKWKLEMHIMSMFFLL